MPYVQDLPFSGNTPSSRHCSYQAAVKAKPTRFDKTQRYLGWLKVVGTATDWQTAEHFTWPLSSVCSIRNGLVQRELVGPAGITVGKFGSNVTLWKAL